MRDTKPKWPVFACVLVFCAITVLTLNSYQSRLGSGTTISKNVQHDANIASVGAELVLKPELQICRLDTSEIVSDEQPPAISIKDIERQHYAIPHSRGSTKMPGHAFVTLIGRLAERLAESVTDEKYVLHQSQLEIALDSQQQSILAPVPPIPDPSRIGHQLASFKKKNQPSLKKNLDAQPFKIVSHLQSEITHTYSDVREKCVCYLQWTRFCDSIRRIQQKISVSWVRELFQNIFWPASGNELQFDADQNDFETYCSINLVSFQLLEDGRERSTAEQAETSQPANEPQRLSSPSDIIDSPTEEAASPSNDQEQPPAIISKSDDAPEEPVFYPPFRLPGHEGLGKGLQFSHQTVAINERVVRRSRQNVRQVPMVRERVRTRRIGYRR